MGCGKCSALFGWEGCCCRGLPTLGDGLQGLASLARQDPELRPWCISACMHGLCGHKGCRLGLLGQETMLHARCKQGGHTRGTFSSPELSFTCGVACIFLARFRSMQGCARSQHPLPESTAPGGARAAPPAAYLTSLLAIHSRHLNNGRGGRGHFWAGVGGRPLLPPGRSRLTLMQRG